MCECLSVCADGIDFGHVAGRVCVVFLILKLIVMEGMCVHLTLGGAENDRPLF